MYFVYLSVMGGRNSEFWYLKVSVKCGQKSDVFLSETGYTMRRNVEQYLILSIEN